MKTHCFFRKTSGFLTSSSLGHSLLFLATFTVAAAFLAVTSVSVYAKITAYDLSESKKDSFTFQEICPDTHQEMLFLITAQQDQLSCPHKNLSLSHFCREKFQEKHITGLTRVIVDNENKKVICERASKVHIEYECAAHQSPPTMDGTEKDYCDHAEIGCQKLKNLLAKDLRLMDFHYEQESENEIENESKNKQTKKLSCMFLDQSYSDLDNKKTEILIKNPIY